MLFKKKKTNRCLVVGAGAMGLAIARGLHILNFDVDFVDPVISPELQEMFQGSHFGVYPCKEAARKDYDVVVSAAPYIYNHSIASWCIIHGMHYCDLGGNAEISFGIHQLKNRKKIKIFTDLGLAPGFANILGFYLLKKYGGNSLKISVGGLPVNPPDDPLRYNLVFNVDGLINEYVGSRESESSFQEHFRSDGKWLSVCPVGSINPDMDMDRNIELFDFDGRSMECFPTYGGLGVPSIFAAENLKNYVYKTIRYPGHAKEIIPILNGPNRAEIIEERCPPIGKNADEVLIRIDIWDDPLDGPKLFPTTYDYINRNETLITLTARITTGYFTAMQKATAFPTAAIAAMMARDEINDCKYDKVDYNIFTKYLSDMNFAHHSQINLKMPLLKA